MAASPSARTDATCARGKSVGPHLIDVEWLVAALIAALAVLTASRSYESAAFTTTLALAPLVAWIVVQDLRSFTIADGAVVAMAGLALAVRVAAGDPPLVLGLDVLLTGGLLLAFRELYFRRRGFDGLGLGDVKLAAAGGLLVGAQAFAWALFAASALAVVFVLATRLGRRNGSISIEKVAFGAALAPAIYAAWLVQSLPVLLPGSG